MTHEHFGPPFDRIVGGSKEERERLRREAEEKINKALQSGTIIAPEFQEYRAQLTEQERHIIQLAESAVDDLARRYGGSPEPLSPERIILLNNPEEKESGRFAAYGTGLVILERSSSSIDFGAIAMHELLHAKSYQALQVEKWSKEKIPKLGAYRRGLVVNSRKKNTVYFMNLDEAVTAELAYRLYQSTLRNNPLFEKEIRAVEEIKPWIRNWLAARKRGEGGESKATERLRESLNELYTVPDAERIAEEIRAAGKEKNAEEKRLAIIGTLMARHWMEATTFALRERYGERQKLKRILDTIREKSGGEYATRDEVFDEFVRAYFTGNVLTVGRLIERSFGKKSLKKIDVTKG